MRKNGEHLNRNLGGEIVSSDEVFCSIVIEGVRKGVYQEVCREFARRMNEKRGAREKREKIAEKARKHPDEYAVIIKGYDLDYKEAI